MFESNDHILFGSPGTDVQLSTLHPQPGQIFKLWQIYLENVDPLLKVTHAPTLQPRVINAAGDVTNISPALEALMFSIYCMALLSLTDSECMTSFASPKSALMATYQYGCQQALLKSTFLRSGERDCLTALFLFLVSKSYCLYLILSLTSADIGQAGDRSSLSILNAWPRFSYRRTHGYP